MEPTGGERGNWCLMKSEKWAGARSYRALLTRARSLDLSQIGRGNQRSWYWISFLKVNNYVTGKAYETMTFRHWIKIRARFGVLRENVKWVSRSPWLSVWWTLWDTVEGTRARTGHGQDTELALSCVDRDQSSLGQLELYRVEYQKGKSHATEEFQKCAQPASEVFGQTLRCARRGEDCTRSEYSSWPPVHWKGISKGKRRPEE